MRFDKVDVFSDVMPHNVTSSQKFWKKLRPSLEQVYKSRRGKQLEI